MSEPDSTTPLVWLRAEPWRFDLLVATITVGAGSILLLAGPDEFDAGWPEVAAGVGAFVLLAFRSRWPWPLFAIAISWTMIHVTVYDRPTQMVFAALVLLATICVRLDRWPAIGFGVLVAVVLYTVGLIVSDPEPGDPRAVIGIAWAAVAVGTADAVRSWRRYRESADAQVRSAVLAAEAQARQQVSEERLTIARELHDLLAHNLSVMNVQTGAALHLLHTDPDQAEQSLTAARDAGRTVLDELRELLAVLRHADSADGSDGVAAPTASLPTVDGLGGLVDTMRAAGLAVTWSRRGEPRPLAPAVSLAAYRITQEALTNAAKHGSGSADLTTEWDDTGLVVRVANPIGGAPGAATGHGLVGMRERAAINGGRLTVAPAGDRFVVDAWLPVAAEREVGP